MTPLRLEDLRTRILFSAHVDGFHDLDPVASDETAGQANLDYAINQAKDAIVAELESDFKFEEGISITTYGSKRSYDMLEHGLGAAIRIVSAYTKDPDRSLIELDLEQFRNTTPDETSSTSTDPSYFVVAGKDIIYWPTPADGKVIYHDIQRMFIDLKNDGDTLVDIGVPVNVASLFERALINKVAIEIADYDENSDKMARRSALYRDAMMILKRSSKPVRKRYRMGNSYHKRGIRGPHFPPEYPRATRSF